MNLKSDPLTSEAQAYVESCARGNSAFAILGHRRKLDRDAKGGSSEDFCRIVSSGDLVVGILADGVSQSFHGYIAAQELVNGLLDFLSGVNPFASAASSEIAGAIKSIAENAARKVSAVTIDPSLPERRASVIEERRVKNGSQAVFAGFVYDCVSQRYITLQLGDARLRVFNGRVDGVVQQSLRTFNKNARFSSIEGIIASELRVEQGQFSASLDGPYGILIHSDGVADTWAEAPYLDGNLESDGVGFDFKLDPSIKEALENWAHADDASLIGIVSAGFLEWTKTNPMPVRVQRPTPSAPVKDPEPVRPMEQVVAGPIANNSFPIPKSVEIESTNTQKSRQSTVNSARFEGSPSRDTDKKKPAGSADLYLKLGAVCACILIFGVAIGWTIRGASSGYRKDGTANGSENTVHQAAAVLEVSSDIRFRQFVDQIRNEMSIHKKDTDYFNKLKTELDKNERSLDFLGEFPSGKKFRQFVTQVRSEMSSHKNDPGFINKLNAELKNDKDSLDDLMDQ